MNDSFEHVLNRCIKTECANCPDFSLYRDEYYEPPLGKRAPDNCSTCMSGNCNKLVGYLATGGSYLPDTLSLSDIRFMRAFILMLVSRAAKGNGKLEISEEEFKLASRVY